MVEGGIGGIAGSTELLFAPFIEVTEEAVLTSEPGKISLFQSSFLLKA